LTSSALYKISIIRS